VIAAGTRWWCLHRYNLEKAFKQNPDATLEQLQTIACADDRRDVLYALVRIELP